MHAEAFFENVDDIINEEDIEESVINQSIRKCDVSMTHNSQSALQLFRDLDSARGAAHKDLPELKRPP